MMPQRPHLLAIERIAPTLRALAPCRWRVWRGFTAAGAGWKGGWIRRWRRPGCGPRRSRGLAMGYSRLSAGRTSVMVDAAPRPTPRFSYNAHASTLALELTSGRRPIIVNCGSGADFGAEWRRAGRATPSHSAPWRSKGISSSRFAPHGVAGDSRGDLLVDGPREVRVQQSAGLDGFSMLATHDGYAPTHGLLHVRRLDLSLDGRYLRGEDTLGALSETDRITFEAADERAPG